MNTPLPLSPAARKIKDLQEQHEYLLLLREHHLLWIKQTHDHEIIRMHHDIINLIKQLEDQYGTLLDALRT
ncbi:MAG TPA: hypothetical protein VF896_09780 [Anaerolineales bacterium]